MFHVHEGGMLVWSAEKNKEDYADRSMKMVIQTTSSATASGLDAAQEGVS